MGVFFASGIGLWLGLAEPAGAAPPAKGATARPESLPWLPEAYLSPTDAPSGAPAARFTGSLKPVEEAAVIPPIPRLPPATPEAVSPPAVPPPPCYPDVEVLPVDLLTALRLVNQANPTVAVARVRVQEAYLRQRQAEVLWLPNWQDGPSYNRHDGLLQTSTGSIVEVNKWNLFYGDTLSMSFPLADAFFLPLVARQLTQAEAARARAVTDNVQLDVALTYLDLLQVYGQLAINAEALAYAGEMLRFALVSRQAELGKTPADAPRARAEVEMRRKERIDLEARVGIISARLAQLLVLRPTVDLRPAEPAIVPIALVPTDGPLDELVATGMMNRPELAESRALVGAALAAWRQVRVAPLLPRIDVSYLAGEFGGGIQDSTTHFRGRGDGFVQATWEVRNLGLGDLYRAREGRARYQEANLHVVEIQAQVAAEVVAAAKDVRARQRTLASAQTAVQQAEETWKRLYGGAFGMNTRERRYDPLEPLIAEQQVAQARNLYLQNVIEFNKAQFRLYAALGYPPLAALPKSTALPVEVPVEPPPPQLGQPLELRPPQP